MSAPATAARTQRRGLALIVTMGLTACQAEAPPDPSTAAEALPRTRIVGSLGDDDLVGPANVSRVTVEPSAGADRVVVHGDDARVVLYDTCELTPGKHLVATAAGATLVLPVPRAEAEARGVEIEGFGSVVVDPDSAHRSECHCFHGEFGAVVGEDVVCGCDGGWAGERCDICMDPTSCFPESRTRTVAKSVLAAAPPSVRDADAVQIQTATFLAPILTADSVVVASVKSTEESEVEISPGHTRPVTDITLRVQEVVAGPELAELTVRIPGSGNPDDPTYISEGPQLTDGPRRLYAVRLRADHNQLAGGAADWRVGDDGVVDLGFYRTNVATVRTALGEADRSTR